MLAIHDKNVHGQGGQERAGAAVKMEKVPRPVMKKGIGEDKFLYFKNQWARYKRSTGLTDSAVVVDQLLACCYEDLRSYPRTCTTSTGHSLTRRPRWSC